MERQEIILDDWEESDLHVGLLSLQKKIPPYEFFFSLNQSPNFQCNRLDNLIVEGHFYDYQHLVYQGYDQERDLEYYFIGNHSVCSTQKKEITELFIDEGNSAYLLKNMPEIDFIIQSKDIIDDFSLILLPENLAHPVQDLFLSSEEELYHTLQYYE